MTPEASSLLISILNDLRYLATKNEDPDFPSSCDSSLSSDIDRLERLLEERVPRDDETAPSGEEA